MSYRVLQSCRICAGAGLNDVYRIPAQYLSPRFVKSNDGSAVKVPMTLTLCTDCGHLQLREEVEPDQLYRQYFYRSATSDTMRADLNDVVSDILSRVELKPGEIVVDIGANDATLLSLFPSQLRRVGFEPARNIEWPSSSGLSMVNDYFSASGFHRACPGEKAGVLTCCAMFYDVGDPNDFVRQAASILGPEGLWCIQLSYLPLMLSNLNFYDICHEHLSYHSLESLERLLNQNGLEVFEASTNAVNGGSIRVLVRHRACQRYSSAEGHQRLEGLRESERGMALKSASTYGEFAAVIEGLAGKVREYLEQQVALGQRVIGLGASTKGNVLLQLFGLEKVISQISERNPEKVGLRTWGTDIELISEEAARSLEPAVMLVLPWYYKDEIVARERDYLARGGTLLFPMPTPHLVTAQGERPL